MLIYDIKFFTLNNINNFKIKYFMEGCPYFTENNFYFYTQDFLKFLLKIVNKNIPIQFENRKKLI